MSHRTIGVLLAMVVCLAFLPGCMSGCFGTRYEQTTSFSLPAPAEASGISVETRNGAVTIRRAESNEIAIEAHLAMTSAERLEQTTISANRSETDGILEVRAIPPGSWRSREGCSFNILIPDTSSVRIRTSNGRIELVGLAGPATLKSSNGRITITEHDGDVSAESSNGRIIISEASGRIKVRTSNGAVTVRPAQASEGPLDIRTSNGAVTIQLPTAFTGLMNLQTSNGSITIHDELEARFHQSARRTATVSFGQHEERETSQVRTSNGSIRIEPAQAPTTPATATGQR